MVFGSLGVFGVGLGLRDEAEPGDRTREREKRGR